MARVYLFGRAAVHKTGPGTVGVGGRIPVTIRSRSNSSALGATARYYLFDAIAISSAIPLIDFCNDW